MINKKRNGFTIVELVIVIVIVGVLAAVLIPTFGSLIKKANESADMQTVYQMNIILAAELIKNEDLIAEDGTLNRDKFKEILAANGIDLDNLEPSSEDLEFKWDSNNKVVILVRPSADGSTLTQIYPPVSSGDGTVGSGVVDLNATPVENISTIDVVNGGTYYLKEDLTITSESTLAISSGATITLNLNDHRLIIGDVPNNANVNAGNVVLATATVATGETPLINVSSGTLNINGGTIISTAALGGGNSLGLVVGERGTLNLNGTNLELIGDVGIQNNPGGTVNINGGVFAVAEDNLSEYNLLLYNIDGTMTVRRTSFLEKGTPTYRASLAPIYNKGGTIYMEGVSISSSGFCTAGAPTETANGKITIDASSTLTLTGDKYIAPCENHNAYNIYIDGGYYFTDNNDPVFSYSGAVDRDGIYFKIKDACADEDGEPIELEEDFTLFNSIVVNETPTIDLNGKTLTIYYEGLFTGDGTLNITGSGTLDIDCYVEKCFSGFSGKLSVRGGEDEKINVIVNDSAISELFTALNKGYEFKNCTLTNSSSTIAVNNEGVISLESDVSIPYSGISIPGESTVTIDLKGKILNTSDRTITVPNNSTLNILNTNNTKNGEIHRSSTEKLFVAEGDSNMGKVNLENVTVKHDAFLSHIMENENTNITASNVSINDKATLTKKVDNNGKIKTTLTLDAGFTLPCNLTVSDGNTLTIDLNGNMLSTGDKVITVSGDGSTLTVNGVNGGTVYAGAVPFKTENGGDMKLTDVTVTVSTDQQFFFALLADVMGCNSASDITYGYLIVDKVDKKEGNETTITIDDKKIGNAHFSLSKPMIIPEGCVVTMNLSDRGLDLSANITIGGTFTMNNGSLHVGDGKFIVESTGTLNLAAKNYYDSLLNENYCNNKNEVLALANKIVDNTKDGTFNLIYPTT